MPKASVILLSYNQSAFLAESVESVLAQTCGDFELVVIDNGSTDDSPALLQRYATDPRVKLLLRPDNQACTKRLNEGVRAATSEFVSILYSDDYYLPRKLEAQLNAFSSHPDAGVVYSPGYRLNHSTRKQWLDPTTTVSGDVLVPFLDSLYRGAYVNPISPLVRRECFVRYPFDESIFIEGEAIYLRMAQRYRFSFDPEPVVVMRDHGSNLGRALKKNAEYFGAAIDALERHPDFPTEAREALHQLRVRRARGLGWQGVRVVDDPHWARAQFADAIARDWRQLLHPKVAGGLILSVLPPTLRRGINQVGFMITRPNGHTNYVAG